MRRLTITFFAILLVVGLAMPMTSVGANGSSWEFIEEFNVDSNTWASGEIAYSSALIDGGHYVFVVSGTWYANAGITADAKYSKSVGGGGMGLARYLWFL